MPVFGKLHGSPMRAKYVPLRVSFVLTPICGTRVLPSGEELLVAAMFQRRRLCQHGCIVQMHLSYRLRRATMRSK